MNHFACTLAGSFLLVGAALPALADPVDDALAGRIGHGTLTESHAALALLVGSGADDRTRLALGVVETLLAGELLVQRLYQHGFGEPTRDAGMGFLPALGAMPHNAKPMVATPDLIGEVATEVHERLERANRTLAEIDDPNLKLRVDVAAFRIDVDASGAIDPQEIALNLFRDVIMAGRPAPEGESFELALDRADVEWLRAYCCLLTAATEIIEAHDFTELFQRTGHVLFPNVKTDYPFLLYPGPLDVTGTGFDLSDVIALIHLINLPVERPELLADAHGHLLQAVAHSASMWRFIEQETDDDREWIPGPTQTPAISGVRIDAERIAAWRGMLVQAEEALSGRRLVRFWRGDGSQGINLKRVFTEPTPFDLVLWIQGSAARPYLEQGELLDEGFWRNLEAAFGNDVWGYLFYIN